MPCIFGVEEQNSKMGPSHNLLHLVCFVLPKRSYVLALLAFAKLFKLTGQLVLTAALFCCGEFNLVLVLAPLPQWCKKEIARYEARNSVN